MDPVQGRIDPEPGLVGVGDVGCTELVAELGQEVVQHACPSLTMATIVPLDTGIE